MTRPTVTPEWASDAGRRLEPAEGRKDTGWQDGDRVPARLFNWVMGVCSDWSAYLATLFDANDEHTYPTPPTRSVIVAPASLIPKDGSAGHGFEYDTSIDPAGWPILRTLNAGTHLAYLPLNRFVPAGAQVTRIRANIDFNSDTGHLVELATLKISYDNVGSFASFFGLSGGGTRSLRDSYSGASGGINLDSGDLSSIVMSDGPVNESHMVELQLDGEGHQIIGLEVSFTDPGLRNR